MTAKLVASIDTSGDKLTVSLGSFTQGGVTGSEKALAAELVKALASSSEFPRISGLAGADSKAAR